MFLQIDGHRFFALSFGAGPRTLLAHSGWAGNYEDWIATLAPLSAHMRVVIYDHRGTGETQVPPEAITAQAMVDDVFRVMDALGIDHCALAGFSAGTSTVLRAAVAQPSRFDALILMNGHGEVAPPGSPPSPRIPPSQWPGASHLDRLAWFAAAATPEPDSDHIRRWGLHLLSRATPEAAERLVTMPPLPPLDWPQALAGLALPTLLIHGEKDVFCSLAGMDYCRSLIPGAQLEVMAGSGHVPAMTRPQDVAKLIQDFLTSGSQKA